MVAKPGPKSRRPSTSSHPAGPQPASGLWRAGDGTDVYFEDSGGDGPVLFYIYGLACSIRHWKYPLAYFGRGGAGGQTHRQVWLDFRGHGRSRPNKDGGPLRVRQILDDIQGLCSARAISAATFLGQSMGGSIALELAHDRPDLVRGLVLLTAPGRDPGAFLPMQPVSRHLWRGAIELNRMAPMAVRIASKLIEPYRHRTHQVVREVVRNLGFNPELSRTDDIDEYVAMVLDVDPNYFYDMAADLQSFDIARLEPQISQPALVIAGERDRVVPIAEARRLAAHLPKGELVVVAHGSHCPHFDDPGRVNGLIEDFLIRHGL